METIDESFKKLCIEEINIGNKFFEIRILLILNGFHFQIK